MMCWPFGAHFTSVESLASNSHTRFLSLTDQMSMLPLRFPKPPSMRRLPCGLKMAALRGPVPKSNTFSHLPLKSVALAGMYPYTTQNSADTGLHRTE